MRRNRVSCAVCKALVEIADTFYCTGCKKDVCDDCAINWRCRCEAKPEGPATEGSREAKPNEGEGNA